MDEQKQTSSEARAVREQLPAPSPEPAGQHRPTVVGELGAIDEDIASARARARAMSEPPSYYDPLGVLDVLEHPEPHASSVGAERVTLRDGTAVLVRPIQAGDSPELETQLEQLSALSLYRLFRTPRERYDPTELAWVTRVDHRRHEALVALDPRYGQIVGVARYLCDPGDQTLAHVTCVIADGWHNRGVGGALFERLVGRARRAGVKRLTARMLYDNSAARKMLARVSDELEETRDGDVLSITARLCGT